MSYHGKPAVSVNYVGLGSTTPPLPHLQYKGLDMAYKQDGVHKLYAQRLFKLSDGSYRKQLPPEIMNAVYTWTKGKEPQPMPANRPAWLWGGIHPKPGMYDHSLFFVFPKPLTTIREWQSAPEIAFGLVPHSQQSWTDAFEAVFLKPWESWAGFWEGLKVAPAVAYGGAKTIVVAGAKVVGDVLDKLGDAACAVVSSDVGGMAAVGVGTAYGGPAGGTAAATGVAVGKGLCADDVPPPPPPPTGLFGFPILPIAIVAGGALLIYLGTRDDE